MVTSLLTKAIVVSQSTTQPNKFKVRIPALHGVEASQHCTRDEDLPEATVCGLPHATNQIHVGDIVFVGFDTNDNGRPIILGHLFAQDINQDGMDLTLRSLEFEDKTSESVCFAQLPTNTSIGEVTKENISCLKGLEVNVQETLNYPNFQITEGNSESFNPKRFYPNTDWECLGKLKTFGTINLYVWHKKETTS